MPVLRQKLGLVSCVFSAVALAGCATFLPNETRAAPTATPNASGVAVASVSSSQAQPSWRSTTYTQQGLSAPVNIEPYVPAHSLQSASPVIARSSFALEALDYVDRDQPELKVLTPYDEAHVPTSGLSRERVNGLGLDEWTSSPALNAVRGSLAVQRQSYGTLGQESYNAEFTFAAPSAKTGLNFDLGLVPSLGYAQEGDFIVRRVGAEFRFGQDIDQRGNYNGLPSWYFFAGADGEAVIFNNSTAGNGLGLIDGLQLRDQVTVGDIQAGLNLRYGGTNVAFNYIRREVEYEFNSENIRRDEDFGGITFTWRR